MTTGIYYKIDGVWTQVVRPYVKVNDSWVPAKKAYVKRSGAWVECYQYDLVPPEAPMLSIDLVETKYGQGNKKTGRHLKIGVRLPGDDHDPDLRMIRVLTTYNKKAPTTQFGGNYVRSPSKEFPDEPWSDFLYSGAKADRDSSAFQYKKWPRDAGESNTMEAGTQFFGAWAVDDNGNWSPGTILSINVPKANADVKNVVVKEARFSPNGSGTYKNSSYVAGDLRQGVSPRSHGYYFFGTDITEAVGKQGAVTIRSAQIRLSRAQDTGDSSANIYAGWVNYGSSGGISGGDEPSDIHRIGELAKGRTDWLDLPDSWKEHYKNGVKGLVFWHQDPRKVQAGSDDYSVLEGTAGNRNGEIHLVWEEAL